MCTNFILLLHSPCYYNLKQLSIIKNSGTNSRRDKFNNIVDQSFKIQPTQTVKPEYYVHLMMGWNGGVTVASIRGFYTMDHWLYLDYNLLLIINFTLFRSVYPIEYIAWWMQTISCKARLLEALFLNSHDSNIHE